MDKPLVKYSKFPKKESNYTSFDVIEYQAQYFCGFNLSKTFSNYLAKMPCLSVMRFDNLYDAEKYFDSIEF